MDMGVFFICKIIVEKSIIGGIYLILTCKNYIRRFNFK